MCNEKNIQEREAPVGQEYVLSLLREWVEEEGKTEVSTNDIIIGGGGIKDRDGGIAPSSNKGGSTPDNYEIPKDVMVMILYCISKYGTEAFLKSLMELKKSSITVQDIKRLKEEGIKKPEEYFKK